MSQFTSVRGVNPEITDSEVLLDTRKAVLVKDRVDGVAESVVEGDIVVLVTPKGNDGNASIYVNDHAVANAWPVDKAKSATEQVVKLVKKGKSLEEIEAAIND
jgi:hypothetical protein